MKTFLSLLFIFLTGCSSIEVSHDYDKSANFTKIKTLQWLPVKMQTAPKQSVFAKENPLIDKRIRQAITREMASKGVALKSKDTTGYISYQISQDQKTITRSATRFGIGLGTGFNHGFGSIGINLMPDQEVYQESELTIDIKDKNQQLIWRGKSSSPINPHPTTKETSKLINEIVKKLLEQYPPK